MNVIFYNNKSDKRVLNKNISRLDSADCDLKEPCSIIRPRLLVSRKSVSNYAQCNYMYISKFCRYYYVSLTALPGDMLQITGESDPIMSAANDIKGITTTILRQEFNYNNYFIDNMLPTRQTRQIQYVKVGDYNAGDGIYLTVDGGNE